MNWSISVLAFVYLINTTYCYRTLQDIENALDSLDKDSKERDHSSELLAKYARSRPSQNNEESLESLPEPHQQTTSTTSTTTTTTTTTRKPPAHHDSRPNRRPWAPTETDEAPTNQDMEKFLEHLSRARQEREYLEQAKYEYPTRRYATPRIPIDQDARDLYVGRHVYLRDAPFHPNPTFADRMNRHKRDITSMYDFDILKSPQLYADEEDYSKMIEEEKIRDALIRSTEFGMHKRSDHRKKKTESA